MGTPQLNQLAQQGCRVEGVIWDIDDVLIDTQSMLNNARQAILLELNTDHNFVPFIMQSWDRLFWFYEEDDLPGILQALSQECGLNLTLSKRLLLELTTLYTSVWRSQVFANSDMVELVRSLHHIGIKQGIVSNGEKEIQLNKLSKIGLDKIIHPDAIMIAPAGSQAAKPHPNGLMSVCSTLDLQPAQVAFIGDRPTDIIAGNLAGVITILLKFGFVPAEFHSPPIDGQLRLEHAHYVVNSSQELHELLELLRVGA